mgnify:CR=1 FL=1
MDSITKQRIALLHPKVTQEVTKIIEEIDQSLNGRAKVRIAQGIRTKEEQDALYAQGRTKPGKKVTNAKFGQSFHCYGLAVDIVLIVDGKEASWDITKDWDNDRIADWTECVNVFKKYGWDWGGNWKSLKDYPHFEKTYGYTWKQLLQKYNEMEFISGSTYVLL